MTEHQLPILITTLAKDRRLTNLLREADMFWRRRNERKLSKLMGSMSEGERIATVAAAAGHLALAGHVHIFTVTEQDADSHAQVIEPVLGRLGVSVARLLSHDSDELRAAAYQADITIGTVDAFTCDFERSVNFEIARDFALAQEGRSDIIQPSIRHSYRNR